MHFKMGLCLLACAITLPAQAQSLWLFSGDEAWQMKADAPPVLRHPKIPQVWSGFELSRNHDLVYSNDKDEWLHFDLNTGKSRVILKRGALGKGFPYIYPNPQTDGSYYAKAVLPYGIALFHLPPGKAPQRILARADLYSFEPLPQGGYVFVTWDSQGPESPDFIDFVVGKKMRLWYQPKTGKAKQIGAFDSIQNLRVVDQGRQVVFFTPGKTQGTLTWRLLRVPLSGNNQPLLVSEIVKPQSTRGFPLLATWPHLDWIVYASPMGEYDKDHLPQQFMRQRLGQAAQPWLEHQESPFLKGWSADGYISRPRRQQGNIQVMECWSVRSGEKMAEYSYDWNQVNPGYAICTDQ
jgi:hypothetical protein